MSEPVDHAPHTTEPDLSQSARVAVRAAQHVGGSIACMHATALAEAAASTRELEWLSERLATELRDAHAALRHALDDRWTAQASGQELVDLYELARIWRGRDLDAARAELRILNILRTRYGIRADGLHPTERRP